MHSVHQRLDSFENILHDLLQSSNESELPHQENGSFDEDHSLFIGDQVPPYTSTLSVRKWTKNEANQWNGTLEH